MRATAFSIALNGLIPSWTLLLSGIWFMALGIAVAWGQTSPIPPARPKVGLVLSGGGAKGLAHIGVLKVLEREGVKIDYIGGTSMGAIIGGLYAAGYRAAQIDSIFHTTDPEAIIKDKVPRSSRNFFEKRNQERYALTLPFEKFKLSVPISLSKGLYNYNFLVELLHHVGEVTSFQALPIPFYCVATDIEKGKPVVFHEGYLPEAILASSAFPSLYAPVEVQGHFLIDGGITDNYPVEEMRKLGIDVVIGVDVQDELKDRTELQDASKILVQVTNVQMLEKMKYKQSLTDIYLRPDISAYSVISFDKIDEIIRAGEAAAEQTEWLPKIKALSTFTGVATPHPTAPLHQPFVLERIVINPLKGYTRAYVLGKLHLRQGDHITFDDLKAGIINLEASQSFSSIQYRLEHIGTHQDALYLELKENPNQMFVRLGLHYDALYQSAVLINFTHKRNIFKNDVASLDLGLGDNLRYAFDYYIDNGFYWSFGVHSQYNMFNRNVQTDFSDGALFREYGLSSMNINYRDFTQQAYIQTIFANRFLIGGGLEFKQLRIDSKTIEDTRPIFENSNYTSAYGYAKYDSLDDVYFPNKGVYFQGDVHSYLFSSNYTDLFNRFTIVKGEIKWAFQPLRRTTLLLQSEGGMSVGQPSVPFLNFALGGYGFHPINNVRPFLGYDFLSFSANSYLMSSIQLDYELVRRHHLNASFNMANADNDLIKRGLVFRNPSHTGYALGYGFDSVIGPCEFKYSWSPEVKRGIVFVSVGFWF